MAPSPSFNGEEPALPPAKSFEQRPTAPVPRQAAQQRSDNIYAGAGSASSSRGASRDGRVDNIRPGNVQASAGELTPSPSAINEPSAPLPTPAQAFERRLAENPIVPAGAFGGSRPTAHFFSQSKPSPPTESSPPGDFSPQDEAQAKWRSLDESEKKRIASEAYKTFEKQITDSRNSPKSKGGVPLSRSNPPNLLSSLSQGNGDKRDNTAQRDSGQEMNKDVAMSPDNAKFGAPVSAAVDGNKRPHNQSTPRQSATDIQKSATAASAKRMSLAERAAQAEADRKAQEKKIKAEQRRASDTSVNGTKNKPAGTASSGQQSPNNGKVNGSDSLELEPNSTEQKEKGDEQAPKQIKNSEASPSGRVEEKKEPIKNSADKNDAVPPSKASPKQSATKDETSDKTEKQQTTIVGSADNGKVKKKSTPAKNGLKAPKYDVIVKAPSEMDMQPLDMPQLLQGSLTDLLKEGPKRGSSGNSKPSRGGRSDY